MSNIITPIILMVSIGGFLGLTLGVLSKIMVVDVDPVVEAINNALPGVNCGACGYAGCSSYAYAIVNTQGVKTNLCSPGGNDVAQLIGGVLGITVESLYPLSAVVKCSGTCDTTGNIADYRGVPTCKACNKIFGGNKDCDFGCLGYGDCIVACPFNAMYMNNGIPVVDKTHCVGCGLCVSTCPHNIIVLEKSQHEIKVMCNSNDSGKVVRQICSAGCIGCKICVKACPQDAITVTDFLAIIDVDKCLNCLDCVAVCPTQVIKVLKFTGQPVVRRKKKDKKKFSAV